MVTAQPRVQAPATARPGEIIQLKVLVTHPMETGLRHDSDGRVIPRDLINTFTCRFDDQAIFSVDLREAMSANPFFEFSMRATRSGTLHFTWIQDGGATYTLEKPLTVG